MIRISHLGTSGAAPGAVVSLLLAVSLLSGCSSQEATPKTPPKAGLAPPGSTFRLLVVDDPALAAALGQLGGEWTSQSGYALKVEERTAAAVTASETLSAEAILCAPAAMGVLAQQGRLRPIPDPLLRDEQGGWNDIFPLLRSQELTWAGKPVAVAFGSPLLVVYYRADLLEKLGRKPPKTWAEYQRLAAWLTDRKNLGDAAPAAEQPWQGALEPLAPGWAGKTLLARAAAYASYRSNFSVLFNIETMEPLIEGAPFVRALEELAATAGSGDVPALKLDPSGVRTAFWQGQCGLALSWPTAAEPVAATPGESLRVGFLAIPGAPEVYNVSNQSWERRREGEETRVPLLAMAGRVGVVPKDSPWPETSFQLLLWLSKQWGAQLGAASPATTLFRATHMKAPSLWVEKQVPVTAAADYSERVADTLSGEQRLSVLRIAGGEEYLAALDEAVARVVRGDQKPPEALREAATRWREITERHGLAEQRQAYRASLGLE